MQVVGVPLSGGALNGVDALYATVQMPKGIPVATVAVDGSANAGMLVAQVRVCGCAKPPTPQSSRRRWLSRAASESCHA